MKPESYCDICSKRRKREESVRVGAVEDDEEIDEAKFEEDDDVPSEEGESDEADDAQNSEAEEEEGRSKPIFFGHLPDVALRRIFAELTVGEKLRTAPVCKAWNSYVTISLRSETELSYRQLYSRAFQDHESRYTLYEGEIKKVVRRMCHPETGLTQLRTVDLKGIVFDSRSSCREDVTFLTAVCPNLEQFFLAKSASRKTCDYSPEIAPS